MNDELKSNLLSAEHWLRFVYMVLFVVCLYLASFVMFAIVVAQFVFALITGSDNRKLRRSGLSISMYIQEVLAFLTYNAEEKPFPFADWPEAEVLESASEEAESMSDDSSDAEEDSVDTDNLELMRVESAIEESVVVDTVAEEIASESSEVKNTGAAKKTIEKNVAPKKKATSKNTSGDTSEDTSDDKTEADLSPS